MKANKYIIASAMAILSGTVCAQSAYDVYTYSRKNTSTLTARAAAMGGAFTSLGGDPSSIAINPAGLGIYRSSEVSITPSIKLGSASTYSVLDPNRDGQFNNGITTNASKGYFGVNNVNYIQNIINSESSALRSLTIGFSYNRDNVSSQYTKSISAASNVSIIDMYSGMLTSNNVNPNTIYSPTDPSIGYNSLPTSLWGSIAAFKNGSMESGKNSETGLWEYRPDQRSFHQGDMFVPEQRDFIVSKMESFDMSTGINLLDKIYLGTTLGVSSYSYKSASNYIERTRKGNTGEFDYIDQWQDRYVGGISFNLKLGVIFEPIPGLRIGGSYHMPKITQVRDEYALDQTIGYIDAAEKTESLYSNSPIASTRYTMKGAGEISGGISYVIRGFGVISFDYNRVWYNKMSMTSFYNNDIEYFNQVNQDIKDNYKAANNYKAGLEVYLGANLYARGGFAYYSSPWKNSTLGYDDSVKNISGGFGYKNNKFYIDITYINSSWKSQPYTYYASDQFQSESIVYPKINNSTVSLTVGFRF